MVQGSDGKPPAVVVLPAFKTNYFRLGIDKTPMRPELVAEYAVNATKDQLRVMWRKRLINRFNPNTRGHKATNYPRFEDQVSFYVPMDLPLYFCNALRSYSEAFACSSALSGGCEVISHTELNTS